MLKYKSYSRNVFRSILLVVTILILLGSVGTSEASVYDSLTMESQATVSSPEVILQNGTTGTSTIYTNNTSAQVSVTSTRANETEDYVDNNISDVDNFTDVGTHSNFTAQQYGPDLVYDTLQEDSMVSESNNETLYVNSFDSTYTDWATTGSSPYLDDTGGSYITEDKTTGSVEGNFGLANSSVGSGTIYFVRIYFESQGDGDDYFQIYVFNGSSWLMDNETITPNTSYSWQYVTVTENIDSWIKIDTCEFYVVYQKSAGAAALDIRRAYLYVDYVNYQLDLEVQWTNVDYDEANEYLYIYGGAMGAENITVAAWNGTAWNNVANDLSSGWNNVSVSSYLTSANFTIRFKGSNEVSDTTQDSWNIDAALIHIWTYVENTYDYVLRVNNTVTDSWEVRLKKYSNSSIGRLQNCTIYFRNSTNANSTQIVIENGSFNQTEGPWYDLGSLETIYIAMTVEANSTGISYVRTYVEIRIPSTTTYDQYIVTFEIT